MKTVRLLGIVTCSGLGCLIALTTLMVRLRISIRHGTWVLVGFTSLTILGVMAVTAALIAGSISGWIRSRTDAAGDRVESTSAQRLVDGGLAPAMVGVVVVGILLTMSGVDWLYGYLPIAVLAAWLLTFSLLVQRERARALWCLLVCSILAFGVGIVGFSSLVRLRVSEPQLVAAGQQILAGEEPTRAGSYTILSSWTDGECAVMETQDFFIDSHGVAYCEGPPGSGFFTHRFGQLYDYNLSS
jgi:hypothetical protein